MIKSQNVFGDKMTKLRVWYYDVRAVNHPCFVVRDQISSDALESQMCVLYGLVRAGRMGGGRGVLRETNLYFGEVLECTAGLHDQLIYAPILQVLLQSAGEEGRGG